MVSTLNMPFSKNEMNTLKKAKNYADAESWGKLFIQLAEEFVEKVESAS